MLAPIALYPPLLVQILMASRISGGGPGGRWAKQNKDLKGDPLTAAL